MDGDREKKGQNNFPRDQIALTRFPFVFENFATSRQMPEPDGIEASLPI